MIVWCYCAGKKAAAAKRAAARRLAEGSDAEDDDEEDEDDAEQSGNNPFAALAGLQMAASAAPFVPHTLVSCAPGLLLLCC